MPRLATLLLLYLPGWKLASLAKRWKIAETAEFQRNLIDKGFPVMDANQRTEKSVARFKPE
jgi:hypothetical protein